MTTADKEYLDNWTSSGNVGLFSPDGSRLAVVTQKGELKKDVVTYSISVFETATALAAPKPKVVATLSSSSNRPAISKLRWLGDNDTLVFLGEQPGDGPQIYKVSASNGTLEKLTKQATPIVSFSIDDTGDAFVYLTEPAPQPIFSPEMLRRGFFVASDQTWENLYTNKLSWTMRKELYVKGAHMRKAQQVAADIQVQDASLHISPNGAYAFLTAVNTNPPAIWEEYQFKPDGEVTPLRSACLAGTVVRCEQQYLLVDLARKTLRPLINAPSKGKYKGRELASWTSENTILLVNALLPLDSVGAPEAERRKSNVYAAEVIVPGNAIHPFDEREEVVPASSIELDRKGKRIITKPIVAVFGPPLEFRKADGKWKISTLNVSDASPTAPLAVTIDEGINSPPKLVATDPNTKQTTILMDFNPQFTQLTFGKVEIFKWKDRDGQPNGGELYYPTTYVAGERYPLVVQTHGESRERFWIDGPFSTASAAQALANKGFFVLQAGWGDRYDKASFDHILKIFDAAQEGPFFIAMVESAIDELDRRGLIDRKRVALQGFSRSVYDGEYLLTHSSFPIGAAVMADGVDFGYANCLFYLAPSFSQLCEQMNGGVPWGASLANWEKASPSMRLDKIHTPILLQSISAPLGEWETYVGLKWLKKPVELVNFYPEGDHMLVRPQEKLLSQQSAVDWYCFWLKGEEDPDPAKVDQYRRWRELRKLQEQQASGTE